MAPRRVSSKALVVALALATTAAAAASPRRVHDWQTRATHTSKLINTVTTASSLSEKTFDYVIVGGGTSGLVLAARLTENSTATVAVIEAGNDGAAVIDKILAPAQAYFAGIATLTSEYDWHYETTNQSGLNEREIFWPRGKVLGGSSAVNGVYMCRSSKIEHDSWASLYPGSSSTWDWDAIYPYMKKSENWTAPLAANAKLADMTTDSSLHGSSGPIHYSYPGYFYPQVANWIPTLEALGVETRDPAGGETWGAYVTTSAIDPTTWSRSYSKTGYLDPAQNRTNLVVLTGFYATKIIFDGTTATGVSFQDSANGTAYTVNAAQEVILSAGVIGSPQLLQLSGIGDSSLLTPLGINVVVDLPGVGMHLTDHLSAEISYHTSVNTTGDGVETNTTIAAEQLALWEANDPSSLYNSPNDAIAYVNLTTLFGTTAAAQLITDLNTNKSALVEAYSTNKFVQAGYNATYTAEVRDIFPSAMGQAEILMVNTGGYGSYGTDRIIGIQAAIQHPLSRGSVKINSASLFDNPTIDPGYFTHPADIQILREAFKFARTVGQTAPLSSILTTELNPGSGVSTDAEWEAWIRSSASTEYHPAGTCSMLPLDLGGVVDTNMRVHGTNNLRVIDSSSIAENAYQILVASETDGSNSTSGANSGTGSASTASATSTSKSKSAGGRLGAPGVAAGLSVAALVAAAAW
ncbi:hypothetical protein RQP46_010021 [Phenoliferia psychrophenolica]